MRETFGAKTEAVLAALSDTPTVIGKKVFSLTYLNFQVLSALKEWVLLSSYFSIKALRFETLLQLFQCTNQDNHSQSVSHNLIYI